MYDPFNEQAAFRAERTGQTGLNSGRSRFRVTCNKCGKVLHENTTGPHHWYENHLMQNECKPTTPATRPTSPDSTRYLCYGCNEETDGGKCEKCGSYRHWISYPITVRPGHGGEQSTPDQVNQIAREAAIECAIDASRLLEPFLNMMRRHNVSHPIEENNGNIHFEQIIARHFTPAFTTMREKLAAAETAWRDLDAKMQAKEIALTAAEAEARTLRKLLRCCVGVITKSSNDWPSKQEIEAIIDAASKAT